jgi:four helix bundle protein
MSIVAIKSYAFAIQTIRIYKVLTEERKEFLLSKQLLRSGTSIAAQIREAEHAQSPLTFSIK